MSAGPRFRARIAGTCYLITFVAGVLALKGMVAADLIAAAAYVGVTLLFYGLFTPVSRGLSGLAAILSLLGCTISVLNRLHLTSLGVNPLVFFGGYCLLIGYLIVRSRFLPRVLGVLMALGGLSWLTFASPALSARLAPYNLAPGMLGEGALTLWLLVAGLNEQRWMEQAATAP